MYRRAAYLQAGGYADEHIPEDMSLFARILEAGWKATLVDDYTLEYRQHSRSQQNLLKALEIENVYLRGRVKQMAAQIAANEQAVLKYEEILRSRSWRLAQVFSRMRLAWFPPGSLREKMARALLAVSRRVRGIRTPILGADPNGS